MDGWRLAVDAIRVGNIRIRGHWVGDVSHRLIRRAASTRPFKLRVLYCGVKAVWFAELSMLNGLRGQWPVVSETAGWPAYCLRRRVHLLMGRILQVRIPVVVGGFFAVIVYRTMVFYWMLLSMLRESSLSAESAGL